MLHGLTSFLPEAMLSVYDNLEFLIRIVISAVFGIFIGLERTKRQKDAGIRTHCIIAVTSAAFMILSKYAFLDVGAVLGDRAADPARMAAQVVSGISFLGAGVIFKDKNSSIKGLTTAAGMWATAAVGMSIGAGLYWLGVFETAAIMFSQMILHRFPIAGDALSTQEFAVHMADTPAVKEQVDQLLKKHQASIEQSEIKRQDGILDLHYVLRLKEQISHDETMALMDDCKEIYEIRIT